mmetsp:Transcript_27775/g.26577  ORF Transcript_27775/g.26577 Transcript_27775/m.26577 type:complete len:237 (-) Transcript_27775:153-863(-)
MKFSTVVTSVIFIAAGVNAFADVPNPSSVPDFSIGEVDAQKAYDQSSFPISANDLLLRAKELLSDEIELGVKDDGACLADDFEFAAAVVGPIPKDEYLDALKSFSLKESFDITNNYYGFTVDPLQTNRVWFFTRQIAKHIAPFVGAKPENTKDDLVLPPQLMHMDFNEDALLKEFGFYTVDRRHGNTGGLGGAFGFFYGVGKPLPIPECQPYKRSWQFRTLSFVGGIGKKFAKKKE